MGISSGENRNLKILVVIADSLAWILNLVGSKACSVYSGSEAMTERLLPRSMC